MRIKIRQGLVMSGIVMVAAGCAQGGRADSQSPTVASVIESQPSRASVADAPPGTVAIRPDARSESALPASPAPFPSIPESTVYLAAQQRSAAAAHDGKDPARLDRYGQPPVFDPVSYRRDPLEYLGEYDARRIRDTAQDPAAPYLEIRGPRHQAVAAGGSVTYSVTTVPGMPVTALSTGMGAFANNLSVITVAADEQGVATIVFTATPGTTGPCAITVASPVARGAQDLHAEVQPPPTAVKSR